MVLRTILTSYNYVGFIYFVMDSTKTYSVELFYDNSDVIKLCGQDVTYSPFGCTPHLSRGRFEVRVYGETSDTLWLFNPLTNFPINPC